MAVLSGWRGDAAPGLPTISRLESRWGSLQPAPSHGSRSGSRSNSQKRSPADALEREHIQTELVRGVRHERASQRLALRRSTHDNDRLNSVGPSLCLAQAEGVFAQSGEGVPGERETKMRPGWT